jgi:hypothetical protein
MGTFDYLSPSNDIRFISIVPNQLRDENFQVSSFKMRYFHDPWNLTSPSASIEGIGHLGMTMPLSVAEVVYNIFQQASANPDLAPSHELDPILEPIWTQDSLATQDHLDLVFPSDEAILEAMTSPDRLWDDFHHRSYFLLDLRRIKAGEFYLTMNGDNPCHINPLAMHKVYVDRNMASIAAMTPIDIYRTLSVVENVFVREDFSPEEIQIYTELFKEFCDVFS